MASVDLAVSVFEPPSITLRTTVLKKKTKNRSPNFSLRIRHGIFCLGCHYRKSMLDDLDCGGGLTHRFAIGI